MHFLFFNYCNALIVADTLLETKDKLCSVSNNSLAVILIAFGAFSLFLGLKYQKTTLMLLGSAFLTQLSWCIGESYGLGYFFVFKLPSSFKESTGKCLNYMYSDRLLITTALFLVSLLMMSLLMLALRKPTFPLVIVFMGIAFTEGIFYRLLDTIGIESVYIRAFFYFIVFFLLIWSSIIYYLFILATLFSVLGSFMIVIGLTTIFKLDWNITEAMCSSYQGLQNKANIKATAAATVFILSALGIGLYIPQIVRIKEKTNNST